MADFLASYILAVIPKKGFIDWLNKKAEEMEIALPAEAKKPFEQLDVYSDCSLFLIPNFQDKESLDNFIKKNYQEIFKNALALFVPDKRYWPKELSYELFNDYFALELHSRVVDLSEVGVKG